MSAIRRTPLAAALALVLTLAACSKDPAAPPAASSAAVRLDAAAAQRAAAAIAGPAWLRERLPEHTVGYLRIPTAWSLLAAPNGRALDPALASEAHAKLIADLRAGLAKDPLLQQAGLAPFALLLLDDLTAPVEIAIVDSSDIANPASSVFVSAPLKFADGAALNARLAELKTPLPPLGADGKAKLPNGGFVQFDAKAQRLYGLFGMTASASGLDALVQQTAQTRPHPMHATEQQIDASGQGLFYWMSLKGVTGMAVAQTPAAKPGSALRDFLERGQSIAGGWGTAGARGKLQLQFSAPDARLLGYFAPGDFKAELKTAGRPAWALTMALPKPAQLAQLEANLDADFGPGTRDLYVKGREKFKTAIGVDPAELLGLLGGGVMAFEDQAGIYTALHVTERAALYARLDELVAKRGGKREVLKSGGISVHHLYLPGLQPDKPEAGADPTTAAWITLYGRIGSHAYWIEEGDYLVFSQVPQALADRAAAKLDGDLGRWLREQQSYDPNTTLLGITGTTRHAQRKVYYTYLGGLQSLADLLGQPVNLAALPAAAELNLPEYGATGISLDLTRERLGLSLTYEQNPAEVLFGTGGLATVATVGILAAVAVPAYQDYTARAQVSEVLNDAAAYKTAVVEHYQTEGRLPADADELGLDEFGASVRFLDGYYVDDGAIVLAFGDEAKAGLRDTTLVLKPYANTTGLTWQCGDGRVDETAKALSSTAEETTTPAKLLPSECRP